MSLSPHLRSVGLLCAGGALLQFAVLKADEACNVSYAENAWCVWDGSEGCAIESWLDCKDWCMTGNVEDYDCSTQDQSGVCLCG